MKSRKLMLNLVRKESKNKLFRILEKQQILRKNVK